MADKDIKLAAFETARVLYAGLIVTLSTGAILFTAVFRKEFAPAGKSVNGPEVLISAWVLLGIAAVLGIFLLGNLVAILNEGDEAKLDVYGGATRLLAAMQLLMFLSGLGFLVAFFAINLF